MLAISNHGAMLGGGEYSFVDLLSRLPPRWEVLALAPQEGELSSRLHALGIETKVLPLPPMRPQSLHRVLSGLAGYLRLCAKYRPRLIYANGSRAAFYGGIAGRLLGLPMVWHCRMADPDIYLDFVLTRLSSRIVANSQATARRFGLPLRERVKVVHNGLDLQWLCANQPVKPPLIEPGWKVILVVGRLSKWKRHDLAISAFEQVAEAAPELHLICIGDRDPLDEAWQVELQERTRRSAFSNRIHWVGHVDDVRPWYRAASLLVLPSQNEPFGRVLVEAMACGVPVIATRGGGVPEIVRDGKDGLLVDPGRADEMAEAILRVLGDDILRAELTDSARTRAELFSLVAHIARMEQIFEETIKK